MYDDIPNDILMTAYFTLIMPDNTGSVHEIQHVNVQELVASIRLMSQADVDRLFATIDEKHTEERKSPTTMDSRIQMIFSHLVNVYFRIQSEALSCEFLSSRPNTPAQSVMCLFQSLIDTKNKEQKQAVAEQVDKLFASAPPVAVSLPDLLPQFVTDSSVRAWIDSH